ncbi:unnamed protein product, partial [Prorocentrum cordatum]
RAAAAAAAAGGARARRARARLRPGTLLLGGMQGHWGDGISLSSGIVAVRQYKQPRTRADPLREVPTEEEFSTDVKKVVSTKPVARCKWLTRGMEYAGTGRIAATVLYDIVTHPKFSSGFNSDLRTSMAQMLKANMHLFSQKQQRALLAAFVPADKADKGDKKRSRSRARRRSAAAAAAAPRAGTAAPAASAARTAAAAPRAAAAARRAAEAQEAEALALRGDRRRRRPRRSRASRRRARRRALRPRPRRPPATCPSSSCRRSHAQTGLAKAPPRARRRRPSRRRPR